MSQVNLTWTVNNMTRVVEDGFVVVVDWSCAASATDVQGAFYGGQITYKNDPAEPGFIPYDQLTEAQVLGWVYDGLGDQKTEIETTLTAKVEKQLNPTTANGTPWSATGKPLSA
jgi:hypothetical protein